MAQTEKWFFPTVVHLRLRDQSLLKFAPGPRDVPADLQEAEKAILMRHGAKPIELKEAAVGTQSASGEAQGAEGNTSTKDSSEGANKESVDTKKVIKK
jgi:hypothetical protein